MVVVGMGSQPFLHGPSRSDEELKVVERDTTVVEIRLAVPSKENAETICRNWRKKNADIYAYVLNSLLGDQPDPAD